MTDLTHAEWEAKIRAEQAEYRARMQAQSTCVHTWSPPRRALNRYGEPRYGGRLGTIALYETTCTQCQRTEVRGGLARLRREVINVVRAELGAGLWL